MAQPSTSMSGPTDVENGNDVNWSVYVCAQNLPAILNDPKRGKQKDFFTRTWGDSFVETAVIPPSSRLEDVPNSYFLPYCRKLLKRYRKLQERKSSISKSVPQDASDPFFPSLLSRENSQLRQEVASIPKIFFTTSFTVSNCETFREVYGVGKEGIPSKMVQDKLSFYLDLVEVGIAQQISKKSSAFFSAVSTQDKVAEKVAKSIICVRQIKQELTQVRKDNVEAPMTVIRLARRKSNMIAIYQKLQLMSTVHQAQRAIQSLLGNSDYVGALDLISTTQEVIRQELQGLISFRHLDSQLVEIRNAIEKMLRSELERNLSADLNRPIEQMSTFFDKDRLISIILGHLRLGNVAPIVTVLAKEIATAMTATCKQTVIEAVSESDSKSDSLIGSTAVQLAIPQLSSDLWVQMILQLSESLVFLLRHVKDLILLLQNCGDSAIGQTENNPQEAAYINESEEPIITNDVYVNLTTELANQLEKTTTTADERFMGILRARKTWHDRSEFISTLKVVGEFVEQLEEFLQSLFKSGSSTKVHKYVSAIEMKSQSTDFFRDFHQKLTEIVNLTLDREKWKVVDEDKVNRLWPNTDINVLMQNAASKFQNGHSYEFITGRTVYTNGNSSGEVKSLSSKESSPLPEGMSKTQAISPPLEEVRTAEVFFIILQVVAEYCYLITLTGNAEVMLGVVDLMRGANARIAHLVLGAGAVELKVCKSITVSNLAVVVRGLCLLGSILPEIRIIFKENLPPKNHHLLKHVDAVYTEIVRHSEDVESKMVSIIADVIGAELSSWEARPPVPSVSVNNVSKNITKFKEAIFPILTQKQTSELFIRVDKVFRTKLKERIASLRILKDGGPRHGVVTSEMMHYAENLRKLNVLPANVISNAGLTQELWSNK